MGVNITFDEPMGLSACPANQAEGEAGQQV